MATNHILLLGCHANELIRLFSHKDTLINAHYTCSMGDMNAPVFAV